jgi:hypothetical protein
MTAPMAKAGYLPQVSDRGDVLRQQLEAIRAEMGPDTSLADVIRKAIREFIARQKEPS